MLQQLLWPFCTSHREGGSAHGNLLLAVMDAQNQ